MGKFKKNGRKEVTMGKRWMDSFCYDYHPFKMRLFGGAVIFLGITFLLKIAFGGFNGHILSLLFGLIFLVGGILIIIKHRTVYEKTILYAFPKDYQQRYWKTKERREK